MINSDFRIMCDQLFSPPPNECILSGLLFISVPSPSLICFSKVLFCFRITYCPPMIVTCLYVYDKKCVRNNLLDAIKLAIEHPDIESLITKLTKTLDLKYIHDDAHFMNGFISNQHRSLFSNSLHHNSQERITLTPNFI